MQQIMSDCTAIFADPKECEARAEAISSNVNEHIAIARNISGAHAAKTTTMEIQSFLEILPSEMTLVFQEAQSDADLDLPQGPGADSQ